MTDYMVVLHTSDAKNVHFINFKTNFTQTNRPLKRFQYRALMDLRLNKAK